MRKKTLTKSLNQNNGKGNIPRNSPKKRANREIQPYTQNKDIFIPKRYSISERICLKNACDVLKANMIEQEEVKQQVAIKVIMSTIPTEQIAKEIQISKLIPNRYCNQLIDAFETQNHICLVSNYIKSMPYKDIVQKKTHLRDYMRSLLKSIKQLKNIGILHRDIKPTNFLFNQDHGILIDFGLAQFKSQSKIGFYGTQGYEPLEVALNVQPYSDRSQMWSAGVVMLHFMLGKSIVFNNCIIKSIQRQNLQKKQRDNYICSFILQLAIIFGKEKVIKQCKQFGYLLTLPQKLSECLMGQLIKGYGGQEKDLLEKLLELNPQNRITVENALKHQFFSN